MVFFVRIALVVILSVATSRLCADTKHQRLSESQWTRADIGEGVQGHARNHLSVIVGSSTVREHDETAFTAGIDFERELSPHLGVGVVVEHAFGGVDASSLFTVADVHLGSGWVIQLGPGVEFVDDRTLAVARLGVFRELHWKEVVIAPSVSYDLTKAEDTLVIGLAFGRRF